MKRTTVMKATGNDQSVKITVQHTLEGYARFQVDKQHDELMDILHKGLSQKFYSHRIKIG